MSEEVDGGETASPIFEEHADPDSQADSSEELDGDKSQSSGTEGSEPDQTGSGDQPPKTQLQKAMRKIAQLMRRIIVDGDDHLVSPPPKIRFSKSQELEKMTQFAFIPGKDSNAETLFSLHQRCAYQSAMKATSEEEEEEHESDKNDAMINETTDGTQNESPSSAGSEATLPEGGNTESGLEEVPSHTKLIPQPSKVGAGFTKSNMKSIINAKLIEKLNEGCLAENIIRRYHASGSTLMDIDPTYYHKDYHSQHFRAVRSRLIRLIGSTSVRINDHDAMKRLQRAIAKESLELAKAHEEHLKVLETKRLQALLLSGMIKPNALKSPKQTDDFEKETYDDIIRMRGENTAHYDFRKFSKNPTASKYHVLHLKSSKIRTSSDLIDGEEEKNLQETHIPYEKKMDNFIHQTAHLLRDFIMTADELNINKDENMPAKNKRKIPRLGFGGGRVTENEKIADTEDHGIAELYNVAAEFLSQPNYMTQWPQDMKQCFGSLASNEGIPHLVEYKIPDEILGEEKDARTLSSGEPENMSSEDRKISTEI